jgi:hypothetical protein
LPEVFVRSRWIAIGGLITCLANVAQSQELRGVVRDSGTRQPIPGTVLLLLDSAGRVVSRSITNDRGMYRVAIPDAARRIQALHIGSRPRDVRIPKLDAGGATLDLAMATIPTLLEPVNVTDHPNCPRRNDHAAALALWEQARAALLATVVAREANPAEMVRLRYDRQMKDDGDEIAVQTILMDSATAPRPFVAWRAASEFVERGFVSDTGRTALFAAPDADVLLDDAFVNGYCFRIAEPDRTRPHEVGLAFAAANSRRGRIDIEGAVWIDSLTRSLTRIAYRYIGLNAAEARFNPRGRIEFRPMPNGTVLIDRWFIRLGVLDTSGIVNGVVPRGARSEAHELGGEVAVARWLDSVVWHNALGTVRGRLSAGVASGTVVRLLGTPYQAAIDSSGLFEIRDLLPGPYTIGVVDARLAPLGILLRTGFTFTAARDSTLSVFVEVPSAEHYMSAMCDGDAAAPTSTVLVARVNLPSGAPAPRTKLRARGAVDKRRDRSWEGVTDRNGLAYLCGVPLGELIEIRAERPGFTSEPVLLRMPTSLSTVIIPLKSPPP